MILFVKTTRSLLAISCICLLALPRLSAQEYYDEPEPPEIVAKIPTAPSIRGASPEDGSNNLIRNAFVSARMELLDRYQGVDAKSVSENSIRLYPAKEPNKPVKAFITINNGLKNIVLEPEKVLEPETEYVFEINSQLLDLEGIPFENYKSTFKTGTIELPKHIDKNKPRIKVINAKKRIKLNALPEGYLLKKKKKQAEEKAVPVIAEEKVEKEEKQSEKNLTPQQIKKAKLEAAIAAKLAKYNAEKDKPVPLPEKSEQKETTSEVLAKVEVKKPQKEIATEEMNKEEANKEIVAKEPEVKKPEMEKPAAVIAEEVKEELPKVASINYEVQVVRRNKPLPVSFSMPKTVQIRYMIKNESGEIVKKGTGTVEAGSKEKRIPTKDLEPGKYKIAIKAGNLIRNHAFIILK